MSADTFHNAKTYLAKAMPWPEEGEPPAYINIHWQFKPTDWKSGDKIPTAGTAARSLKEAVSTVSWAASQPNTVGVFACQSSQLRAEEKVNKRGGPYFKAIRSQANVLALKSLYLDIDVKDGPNGYPTTNEAAGALNEFVASAQLPKPSMGVLSGSGGLHVYWTMEKHLLLPEWQVLAGSLAEATRQLGLHCDAGCTTDSARILRVPDTLNYKTTPPSLVQLAGIPTDFDYLVEKLSEPLARFRTNTTSRVVNGVTLPPGLTPKAPLQGEDDLSAGIEATQAPPADPRILAKECGFIAAAITTGGKDYDNPKWNLTTLVATFCDRGEQLAHLMADKHPDYTQETTQELYERKQREHREKNLGWPSCRAIQNAGATQCSSCKHLKENKSPINFGLPPPPIVVHFVPGLARPPSTQEDMPAGYSRRADGIILSQDTDEDGVITSTPVLDYRMEYAWLQTKPEMLYFTTTTERNKERQIEIPLSVIGGQLMRQTFQEQGMMLPPNPQALTNLSWFLMAWIKKLQETRDAVHSSPFGWTVNAGKVHGFVFGGRTWTPNGDFVAGNPDTVTARQYQPNGEIDPWLVASKMVTNQNKQDLAAIIASAFAAPLVRFTGQPGVLMSAYSVESGIGKTTAMKIAQAVWGDPIRGIQSLSDTQNSVMHKIGELRSLPLYWDELKTEEDTRKFVNVTFQVTQGKEKSRLTQQAKQREPGAWQTLMISASNDSLLDYVTQHTSTTTAGLYRVFEYVVQKPNPNDPGQIEPSRASLIVAALHDNYGIAGLKYAQFLGANHKRVADDVDAYMVALGREVSTHPDERYWIALITTIVLGAKYANEIGLTEFDEVALKAFMLNILARMRAIRTEQPVDLKDAMNVANILNQYMTATKAKHTLYTNKIHIGSSRALPGTIKISSKTDMFRLDGVYVQVGLDDKLMHISSNHFGSWLKEMGYSRQPVMEALAAEFGFAKVKQCLGAGTGEPKVTVGQQHLLQISLAFSSLIDFIE